MTPTLLLLSTRGLGAPLCVGLPPVCPGLTGQRPHGAPAPRALLVGVLRGLCGRRPHCGRDPLPAAGAALQPLAEVSPTEGRQQQQQQLVARGSVALWMEVGTFLHDVWMMRWSSWKTQQCLCESENACLTSRYNALLSSLQRHEGVNRSSSVRTRFRAGCLWETHYCLTNRPAGFRDIAHFISNN